MMQTNRATVLRALGRVGATCALVLGAAGSAGAQGLTKSSLQAWLARYESAWEMRDADRAAALFTQNALYSEMPFDAPKSGRAGIRDYWAMVTADQGDIEFRSEAIAVAGNTGVAHWSATFKLESTGAKVELDGIFVLELDASGACTSLREWWHVREP
jgi:ketosteroid isomerase-like protein